MNNKKFFITGVPGTGKSTVGLALRKRGYTVFDVDELEKDKTCSWYNIKTGEKVVVTEFDEELLKDHDYACDMGRIDELVDNATGVVFMIGCIGDGSDFMPRFDQTFLLQASPGVLSDRLANRTNNAFGKESETQRIVLEWRKQFDVLVLGKGAISINSEQPIEQVTEEIIKHVNVYES